MVITLALAVFFQILPLRIFGSCGCAPGNWSTATVGFFWGEFTYFTCRKPGVRPTLVCSSIVVDISFEVVFLMYDVSVT